MNNAEKKSVVSEVGSWLWGTIEGGFNEQQSTSQIIVDAAVSMIPIIGDGTAARDLLAVILRLVEHPERRKEKLQWMMLALLLFALIPVAGGAIKGLGRLILDAGEDVAKHGEIFTKIIECLNRLGEGNAVKFIKELNFEEHTAAIVGHCRKVTQTLDNVIDAILRRAHLLIPDAMIERMERVQAGVREVRELGDEMIPDALKELNRRLRAVQSHLYAGEWHEIPATLKSETREVEARLVEREGDGVKVKKWEVHNAPFPGDTPADFHPVEGWPNLGKPPYADPTEETAEVIASFSGRNRPVKIPPGTKIRRVVTETSRKSGAYWVYELPRDGKSWRNDFAVLDSWSKNGFYVELTVPPPGLWAWEGNVASQIEGDAAKATAGQVLRGGATQLHIDFAFPPNATTRGIVERSPLKPTEWKDHMGLNVPPHAVSVQKLGAQEIQSKMSATTGAAIGQRAVRAESKRKRQLQNEAAR